MRRQRLLAGPAYELLASMMGDLPMGAVVKLSDERCAQLRSYAVSHGLGIAEAVGALLRNAGAADEVPGFKIIKLGVKPGAAPISSVQFGEFVVLASAENIDRIADILDQCATDAGTGGKKITRDSKDLRESAIARHRQDSVASESRTLDNSKEDRGVLAVGLALDLAAQLGAAALE